VYRDFPIKQGTDQ